MRLAEEASKKLSSCSLKSSNKLLRSDIVPARFQILISRYEQASRGRAKHGCNFLDRILCPGTSEAMFGIKRSQEDEAIRRSPWSQNLDRKNESALGVRQKMPHFGLLTTLRVQGWLHNCIATLGKKKRTLTIKKRLFKETRIQSKRKCFEEQINL